MPPPPLRPCRICKDNIASANGFCVDCRPEISTGPVDMGPTIAITSGLASSDKQYTKVPLSKVVEYLRTHRECYERTMPTEDEPTRIHNRVYVDIDGELPADMNEADFNTKVADILTVLRKECAENNLALMESSKWKCFDDKGKSSNKLSYRITYPKVAGTKKAICHYVKATVLPRLNTLLKSVIAVKAILKKKAGQDTTGSLIVDLAVYNDGSRKMRMLNQSKPVQNRPNKLVNGLSEDCLITYVPEDCVILTEPSYVARQIQPRPVAQPVAQPVDQPITPMAVADTASASVGDPTEEASKELVGDVLENTAKHRWDHYPDWIRIGFICFNEGFTVAEFIELSKKSKHFKHSSPEWISQKWLGFKRSNLTQALLWKWLAEDDADKYQELAANRKDFWLLLRNVSHAETARFFYNLKPDAYLFNEKLGWYQLLPSGAWKHYDQKPNGLLSDIWMSFRKLLVEHEKHIGESTDAEEQKENSQRYKLIKQFQSNIGNKSFCDGVIAFLPTMYNDDELEKKMDESRHLLAFSDGVYDLDKEHFRATRPDDYICLTTGYPYPHKRFPEARKELLATLRSLFETTEEVDGVVLGEITQYNLKVIATCLHGTKKYEKFYVWTGSGGNGKGLQSEMVKRAFGDYYHSIPHSCLTKVQDKKDAPNPPMAKAKGKRFVQASEPEAEDKLQCGTIKELSGGDEITARDMYSSTITYRPQFSLFLQTNAIPQLNRPDGGIQRRLEVINFPFAFKEKPEGALQKPINHELKDKIIKSPEWRDEMFHLLLESFKDVKKNGLVAPKSVVDASQEYMDDNNPVKEWLHSNYTLENANDRRYGLESAKLLAQFAEDKGFKPSAEKFKNYMTLCGITLKKESHNFKAHRFNDDGWAEAECRAGRYWMGLKRKD